MLLNYLLFQLQKHEQLAKWLCIIYGIYLLYKFFVFSYRFFVRHYKAKRSYSEVELTEIGEKASKGEAEALFTLGEIYQFGTSGKKKNLELAINYYTKAAEAGSSAAAYNLGEIFNGRKFYNQEKAFYWYHKAALAGEVKSYEKLADFYFDDEDYHKAAWWALKAEAETGYRIIRMTDLEYEQVRLPTTLELLAKAVDDIETGQWKPSDNEL